MRALWRPISLFYFHKVWVSRTGSSLRNEMRKGNIFDHVVSFVTARGGPSLLVWDFFLSDPTHTWNCSSKVSS
jgi:hypothetical protein